MTILNLLCLALLPVNMMFLLRSLSDGDGWKVAMVPVVGIIFGLIGVSM